MYCPLCKAEYRPGFDACSDCLVGLVDTYEDAKAAKVILLWKGVQQVRFSEIVGQLRDANVPNHAVAGAQEERKTSFWEYVGIIGYFLRAQRAYEDMSWKIYVLEADHLKARTVVAKLI